MHTIDIWIGFIGPVLNIWLAAVLVWRKAHREFPFFFLYVSSSILIGLIRACVSGNYRLYFEVYWTTDALYVVLALLALHEVFRIVFKAFYERWWFWLFFPLVVIAISILAVIYRFGSPPIQANRVMSAIV